MLHHHRRSVFPLVLGFLTLALAGFVAWSFTRPVAVPSAPEAVANPVSEDEYRAEVAPVVQDYQDAFAKAGTDLERLLVTERASDALLALRVPASYTQLHLDLVLSLNLMRNGLRGESGAFAKGKEQLDRALASTPWLQ